jgi:hypothetical protein
MKGPLNAAAALSNKELYRCQAFDKCNDFSRLVFALRHSRLNLEDCQKHVLSYGTHAAYV